MTKVDVIVALTKHRDKILEVNPRAAKEGPAEIENKSFKVLWSHRELHKLCHLYYMCVTAMQFATDGRIEKAMRWLGFIQGAMTAMGHYSIDELRAINSSSDV